MTENTPKNIMFGAGTVHKGLEYGFTALTNQPSDWTTNYTKYYTRSGSAGSYVYTHVTGASAPTFSSGTYYDGAWNFADSCIGATSGGSKISIVPEITKIEVDGALVAVKGLTKKTGETATMEVNFAELKTDIIKAATIGKDGTSDFNEYDLIESKSDIESGDYLNNIAFVGKTLEGEDIIVIMDNALCTSGFEPEGKNKENAVVTCTFECHADLTDELDKLPWHIYYPKSA